MNGIQALLLQGATDVDHADRAWHRMATWTPEVAPSVVARQAKMALELTRPGAPRRTCEFDR